MFSYDGARLPNSYIAGVEARATNLETARALTGLSVGYPAWNLLYYTLLCSLPWDEHEFEVIETGTNHGFSTIILAQALKDRGARGFVRTVDIDPAAVEKARENVKRAGLSNMVEFHCGNSTAFLARLVKDVRAIHFAFLDASHVYREVRREFTIIHPAIVAGRGKVYFDNTAAGGVARALLYIRRAFPGNLVEFSNCSWSPPGNAIWQPD